MCMFSSTYFMYEVLHTMYFVLCCSTYEMRWYNLCTHPSMEEVDNSSVVVQFVCVVFRLETKTFWFTRYVCGGKAQDIKIYIFFPQNTVRAGHG